MSISNEIDIACALMPDVDKKLLRNWIKVRRRKDLTLTDEAVQVTREEAQKANLTLEAAIRIAVGQSWGGFKASWVNADGTPKKHGENGNGKHSTRRAPDWWTSEAGILAKGKEIGMEPRPGESKDEFRARINARIEQAETRTAQ